MVVPSLHDLLFFEAWCFANFKAALILLLEEGCGWRMVHSIGPRVVGASSNQLLFFFRKFPPVGLSWFQLVWVGLSRFQSTEVDFNQLEAICLSRLWLFLVIWNWLHTLSIGFVCLQTFFSDLPFLDDNYLLRHLRALCKTRSDSGVDKCVYYCFFSV